MSIWVIYENPADFDMSQFKDKFVARRFYLNKPTADVMVASIEALRWYFQNKLGLTRFERSPDDNPKVVETWF